MDEISDDAISLEGLHLQPPPLQHQRSCDLYMDDESPPCYRSAGFANPESFDEFSESPVYRSCSVHPDDEYWAKPDARAVSEEIFCVQRGFVTVDNPLCSKGDVSQLHSGRAAASASGACSSWCHSGSGSSSSSGSGGGSSSSSRPCFGTGARPLTPPTARGFVFDLPPELLDLVLHVLPPHPDLFAAMGVSRAWGNAARFNAESRRQSIPDAPDALLHAVQCAQPGDTLLVQSGVHALSTELEVEQPLRLLAAPGTAVGSAVLTGTHHVLLRTRSTVIVNGLTLCRMGEKVGYPNAVVFAEAGELLMENCRVTCGGMAESVPHALRPFDAATPPGTPWTAERPADAASGGGDDERPQDPQSGVWVGAMAHVTLRRNVILCCLGPGIKIYRGELDAEENTIAFSNRGANIVANGGRVTLLRNEINGAFGDGISSWNNSQMRVERNHIHGNSGAGIAINSGGGSVNITDNCVFENSCTAVLFATSQTKQATLQGNDLSRNEAGGVSGLHQAAPGGPRLPLRVARAPTQSHATASAAQQSAASSSTQPLLLSDRAMSMSAEAT